MNRRLPGFLVELWVPSHHEFTTTVTSRFVSDQHHAPSGREGWPETTKRIALTRDS
jgi:hypothetical protein